MIQINQVEKRYGTTVALSIYDLTINPGETIGLVGNNGAGKTTLFSLMLDLIKPHTGNILINDIDVSQSEDWKAYMGAYVSENFLIDYLTPDEYFTFIAGLHNWNAADLNIFLGSFNEFFNDEIVGKKKYIRDLSKGNQKKVGIVGALIGDPDFIILDEPFANLDPTTQSRLIGLINNLKSSEKTILISSHDLTNVTEVSSRFIVLEKGRLVKDIAKTDTALEELKGYFEV